ncbi:MAG: TolC family protein [Syntrophobacterales bacterium]|nr:TolC family protein [Syntrophobacterales bacterium]
MKKLLALLLLYTSSLWAKDLALTVKSGEVLDLNQCIEIALRHHPDIRAARYNIQIAESKVGQAKAAYYPQLTATTGYSNSKEMSTPDVTGKSFNDYIGQTTLKQTLFDFGRTPAQVDVQRKGAQSSVFDAENIVVQTVFNVKRAYYSLLRAKKNRDVAAEVLKQYEFHLTQAKALYEVGAKPKVDVTKAEVDLTNAKLNLMKAENVVKVAKANLDNAMGVPQAPDYDIKDSLSVEKLSITFEEALQRAYEERSDLKSIKAKVEAAKRSVDLARKDFYPVLATKITYSIPRNGDFSGDDWDVGLSFSVPLFSGFSTVYKIQESRANLGFLQANEDALKQRIYLEVKESYVNMTEAKERIEAASLAARQSKENLELARGRYGVGAGSSIEVTDALVAYARSQAEYIQALYDYKIAEASLLMAMGLLK